jgi:DNA repair exonuclease SbcCD nuclease subunit
MRLVHLADLHLGYRQYQRLTPAGINQREYDVALSFKRAVDQVIALRPDAVLVAGDVFHSSRPTNAAILHAFRQFVRMKTELPKAAIVMVAGTHDTPRTSESGSIMGLFEQIGIAVAASEAKLFPFPELDLEVLGVPDVPGERPPVAPRGAKHRVLVIHADVTDVVPRFYAELDRASIQTSRTELAPEKWSYVALGHYHVKRQVAENAFYSGSLDYTSLNVWGDKYDEEELGVKGKGFIEYDLDAGTHRFHPVPASRDFLDLRALSARDMSPAEVDAAIGRAVEKVKGGIDDKVVRLVIRDVPRQVTKELDQRAIRDYKKRALHFTLDARKPELARRDAAGAPARRPSVTEVVREQLKARPIPTDLDRTTLVDLGMRYLNDAESFPAAVSAVPDADG